MMIFLGWYITNKFNFNYREVIELVALPIAIPMLGMVFITVLTDGTLFTGDTLLGIISLPLLLAVVVAVLYPLLLLPALLILRLKQNYGDNHIVFFLLSALIGGFTLSMVSLELEVILTGMILTLLSVLTQYYYFDKKREIERRKIK
jgi:hypothetical protein